MTATATKLYIEDIEQATQNDEWLGFGYVGERLRALEAVRAGEITDLPLERIDEADELVLAEANRRRMTSARFFEFLNSRDGRYLADEIIGSPIDSRSAERVASYMKGY